MPTIANAKQTNPISPVISVPTKDKIPKLVTEITKEIPLPIPFSVINSPIPDLYGILRIVNLLLQVTESGKEFRNKLKSP